MSKVNTYKNITSKYTLKTALTTILLSTLTNSANASESSNNESYFCGAAVPSVATQLDKIVPTLYSIVSGKADEKRDWPLMQSLFAPNAAITPIFHKNNLPSIQRLSVNDFIALNEKVFKGKNFFETEVSSHTTHVGHMATIISKYESRDQLDEPAYSTGVNSFQLVNDGRRWCVISVTWDSDKGGHQIK